MFFSGMGYREKTVLVTGAGGFIGSCLAERLAAEGAHVRAFLRYNSQGSKGWLAETTPEIAANIEIVWGDLKDPDAVRQAVRGADIVFHLGALIAIPFSYQNPTDFFQTNVLGTLHVANACREFGVERLVHTSTSEVYGTAQQVPMTEAHPQTAQSPYSASKIGADRVVESYIHSYDLPAVILRPFNTYGPRQSERAVIPTIIRQALSADALRLGSVHPTRDFTYVDDTVSAFCAAGLAEKLSGRTVHFGTGRETSIGQVAEIVCKLSGRELPVELDDVRVRPAASEVDRLLCDPTVFRRLTGWLAEVTIEDGLQRVYDYHKAHPIPAGRREFVI
jgi:dTDP-glucose 4,6-dehydratase